MIEKALPIVFIWMSKKMSPEKGVCKFREKLKKKKSDDRKTEQRKKIIKKFNVPLVLFFK